MKKYLIIAIIGVSLMFGACAKDEDYPTEGAPIAADGQLIDEEPIGELEIAGLYKSDEAPNLTCELSMYTSIEDGEVEVGSIVVADDKEELIYWGPINKMMDNYYEIKNSDVTISTYKENGTIHLDLFENGQHVYYFEMLEHYES